MRLGAQAGRYRQRWRRGQLSSADEAELEGMGFAFDHNEWKWRGRVQPALMMYKEVHGDLEVSKAFVVPSSAPWAEETWGMRLGNVVRDIRIKGIYLKGEDAAKRRAWLDEMGFVWDDHERRWEDTRSAMATYKEVHGDLEVPYVFVVPSSAPWAEETWGMRLGKAVNNIRAQDYYLKGEDAAERRAWLDEMGFRWRVRSAAVE